MPAHGPSEVVSAPTAAGRGTAWACSRGQTRGVLEPEVRTVVVCGDCAAFWDPDAETAACTEPEHQHHRYDSHLHRTPVTFADGTTVVAVSFGSADPYAREAQPDLGLYLDERWQPPWPHRHLDWPDFGVPADPTHVRAVLGDVRRRALAGQQVEIGCYGGHGRTGTALGCLAILCGHDPAAAADWVRANYCERAVETDAQEAFVRAFDG